MHVLLAFVSLGPDVYPLCCILVHVQQNGVQSVLRVA